MSKQVVLRLCIFLSIGYMAFADDLNPPEWRYEPGSTFAAWEFLDDDITPVPDQLYNSDLNDPLLQVSAVLPWEEQWGGRQGVWALSGEIEAIIDNYPTINDYKLIQIQLTWTCEHFDVLTEPAIAITARTATGEAVDDIILLNSYTETLELTNEPGAGEFWYNTTYLFQISPNPADEKIKITGRIWVDELVIDTICIPEPTTLMFLGLGVLVMRKRK